MRSRESDKPNFATNAPRPDEALASHDIAPGERSPEDPIAWFREAELDASQERPLLISTNVGAFVPDPTAPERLKGNMAELASAIDPDGERVVLKSVRVANEEEVLASFMVQSGSDLEDFENECELASRFGERNGGSPHPNVLPAYAAKEQPGRTFLVTPYIDSPTLEELRAYTAPPVRPEELRHTIERFIAAADGLEHIHRQGILHRDLKPSNLLIRGDGSPLIFDFGIAAELGPGGIVENTGNMRGTAAYCPPEQLQAQPMSAASDVYSLAATLYFDLTGRRPFEGDSRQLIIKAALEMPAPPSSLNPALPRSIDAIIEKGMAKNPEERYQSAAEFGLALREILAPPKADSRTEPAPARGWRERLLGWFRP